MTPTTVNPDTIIANQQFKKWTLILRNCLEAGDKLRRTLILTSSDDNLTLRSLSEDLINLEASDCVIAVLSNLALPVEKGKKVFRVAQDDDEWIFAINPTQIDDVVAFPSPTLINPIDINRFYKWAKETTQRFLQIKQMLMTACRDGANWAENTIQNCKTFFSPENTATPITAFKNSCNGASVCVVSAGPSLDQQVHLIKQIKNPIIIANNSSYTALKKAGIDSHFCTTADFRINTYNAVKNANPDNTILVASPIANPSTVKHFSRRAYWCNKHSLLFKQILSFQNNNFNEDDYHIEEKGSIAISSLDFAFYLGASKVFLFGQDLCCLPDGSTHSSTVAHAGREDISTLKKIANNTGGLSYTTETLELYKVELERLINKYPTVKVYNASADGAHIEGARYISDISLLIDAASNPETFDNKFLSLTKDAPLVNYQHPIVKLQAVILDLITILSPVRSIKWIDGMEQYQSMCNRASKAISKIDTSFKSFITRHKTAFFTLVWCGLQMPIVLSQWKHSTLKPKTSITSKIAELYYYYLYMLDTLLLIDLLAFSAKLLETTRDEIGEQYKKIHNRTFGGDIVLQGGEGLVFNGQEITYKIDPQSMLVVNQPNVMELGRTAIQHNASGSAIYKKNAFKTTIGIIAYLEAIGFAIPLLLKTSFVQHPAVKDKELKPLQHCSLAQTGLIELKHAQPLQTSLSGLPLSQVL